MRPIIYKKQVFHVKSLLFGALTTIALSLCGCEQSHQSSFNKPNPTIGKIAIWDEDLSNVISTDAEIEVLAEGFQWAEGPAWDPKRQQLYFSDVPQNKAYIWSERNGLQIFLDPSGISNDYTKGFREPGSNGMLMMPNEQLLIANHGKRALELLNLETLTRRTVLDNYEGLLFNSPNDIAHANDGAVFFTDPPYGLEGLNASPLKEIPFNGIYRILLTGELSVIDKSQTFPNGIALSPDEKYLYVAVSDPQNPKIMRYKRDKNNNYVQGELWFDAAPYLSKGWKGLPDGMVVADSGHIYATGPGGVFILTPEGKALGQIQTERATANCTLSDDGKSLYITAGDTLARVQLKK